jgi:hypothetical protein
MNITSKEFKEIFKLNSGYKIPKETLAMFNKQVKGAYLLYLEIINIDKKKFKNFDETPLVAHFIPYRGRDFQRFIDNLGSCDKFEVRYLDNNKKAIPFWTYTKYSDNDCVNAKNSAYNIFISKILNKLLFKYSEYHIKFEFSNYASEDSYSINCHSNGKIWWRGVEFLELHYVSHSGEYATISSYGIQCAFTNRSGIWNGEIPKPIQRIMDEIDLKNNKQDE